MSLADLGETPLDPNSAAAHPDAIYLNFPSRLLSLPLSAAFVGLFIGVGKGGRRARLQFLVENAHRPPKTVQGWYFYTKTRNYRVFFAAAKLGTKYAGAFGAAGLAYSLLDEGYGLAREAVFGPKLPPPETEAPPEEGLRKTWRKGDVMVHDGAVAAGVMALVVGVVKKFNGPVMLRSFLLATGAGALTSGLRVLEANALRAKERETRVAATSAAAETAAAASALATEEVAPALAVGAEPVAPTEEISSGVVPGQQAEGWWSKVKGLVGA
ncbi:hypothetical protein IAT38_004547 [Cryptococcus sp. DSM 104549]